MCLWIREEVTYEQSLRGLNVIPRLGVLGFIAERVCSALGFRLKSEREPFRFFAICLVIVVTYFAYCFIGNRNERIAEVSRKQKLHQREYLGE
jgi:hypothetical protein